MNKRTLLDMVGQIDEVYIAEAAHPETVLALRKQRRRAAILRRFGTAAACIVIVVGLAVAIPYIGGIGVGGDKASAEAENASKADMYYSQQPSAAIDTMQAEMDASATPTTEIVMEDAQESAILSSQGGYTPAEYPADSNKTDQEVLNIRTGTIQINDVIFVYEEGRLTSFRPAQGQILTEVTVPRYTKEIDGTFWKTVSDYSRIQKIYFHSDVKDFGDVSLLDVEITIVCPKGSVAEQIFSEKGYTVELN